MGKHVNGFNQPFEQLWTKWVGKKEVIYFGIRPIFRDSFLCLLPDSRLGLSKIVEWMQTGSKLCGRFVLQKTKNMSVFVSCCHK